MTGPQAAPPPPPGPPAAFRLAYVPGVIPGKWVRIWHERLPGVPLHLRDVAAADASGVLLRGDADAALLRLPVDRTVLSAIPLYTETTVVVVPKDHVVTAADEVSADELADEVVLHPLDDTLTWEQRPGLPARDRPATTGDAVELVAAGVGLLVVPQSLARLHHRRDLTYRTVTDAPQSGVALSWPQDRTTDWVEDFIGIVRGRTVNSTRGRRPAAQEQPQETRSRAGGSTRRGKPSGNRSTDRNPRGGSPGRRGTGRGTRRRRS
ncbi:LysR substrate-binding domain-containing protein [Streptomyces sp. TRM 70351]|uniref:LysR substrate-binding domain-containing protein n=1 Tax=Streptomyces sp. TRM 70351 TaxID=3116552 RepID=UPI002E7B987E|nr:LysR substrate-binding domain-containing protein [Streptomyces sp. TRM 70351]MEE1926710.1 LysR substrate-binding domain-containing protein [Streptomyces sp. TRM 70351]